MNACVITVISNTFIFVYEFNLLQVGISIVDRTVHSIFPSNYQLIGETLHKNSLYMHL